MSKALEDKLERAARTLAGELTARGGQDWRTWREGGTSASYWELRPQLVGRDGRATVSWTPGKIYVAGWYSGKDFIRMQLPSSWSADRIEATIRRECAQGAIESATAAFEVEQSALRSATRLGDELGRRGMDLECGMGARVGKDGRVTLTFGELSALDAALLVRLAREAGL